MLSLLRADFYKLLRRKSFYICGLLGIIGACLFIILENMSFSLTLQSMNMDFESLPAMYRVYFSGISAFTRTVTYAGLYIAIVVSMFVSGEFSFGTIKNIITSGKTRMSIYTSKLIMALVISTIYTLLCALAGFITGSILCGTGEITRTEYLEIFRIIGLVIAINFSMQALFTMVGFVVRSTGGTITINLVISMLAATILPFVDILVNKFFHVEDFKITKYWPNAYLDVFNQLEISTDQIINGLIACAIIFVASTVIGMITFQKRDI